MCVCVCVNVCVCVCVPFEKSNLIFRLDVRIFAQQGLYNVFCSACNSHMQRRPIVLKKSVSTHKERKGKAVPIMHMRWWLVGMCEGEHTEHGIILHTLLMHYCVCLPFLSHWDRHPGQGAAPPWGSSFSRWQDEGRCFYPTQTGLQCQE